jgi:ATP/maltotriose-dependent transcriptional regulator MalT
MPAGASSAKRSPSPASITPTSRPSTTSTTKATWTFSSPSSWTASRWRSLNRGPLQEALWVDIATQVTHALERLIYRLHTEAVADTAALDGTLAGALYFAGRWNEARTIFERLHAEQPGNLHLLGFVTALAAHRGDRTAALAGMERLEAFDQPYLRGLNTYWQAEVATQLGEKRRAVQLLRRAFEEGQPVPVKTHSDPDLEPLREDPEFRRLIRVRG